MNKKASEIFEDFGKTGLLTSFSGADATISNIAPTNNCGPGDLVFVNKVEELEFVIKKQPAAVVVTPELKSNLENSSITVFTSPRVHLAHALVRQKYVDRDLHAQEWPRIHPTAVIHASVQVPQSAVIGPGAIIGRNVQIGENCVLQANVVIEYDSQIGDCTVIHPRVVVGHNCIIGKNVILKAGAVIGSEGFGFVQDENHKSYRVPHTGRVVLEDSVVVGSNTCIDRATYQETRIGKGTIIDNLVHIAHNVKIGENCILTGQVGVAGSAIIGDRFIASGQCGVIDHVTVVDDVTLVHRAGAMESITEPGMYAALPAQPIDEYLKSGALVRKLFQMRKKIQGIEKKLKALEEG